MRPRKGMEENHTEDSVFISVPINRSNIQNQIIAVYICTLGTFSLGCAYGWLPPVLDYLKDEEDNVLDSPLTEDQVSWARCLLYAGALPGQMVFNIISKRRGRKISAYVSGSTIALSFMIKLFAKNSTWILVSQFVSGFGGAGALALPPLYISETVEPRARGTLSTFIVGQYCFGMFVSYILGSLVSYEVFTGIMLMPPLMYMLAFWFMPESPLYRLGKGEEEGAARAIAWLRKLPLNSIEVRTELISLSRQMRGEEPFDSTHIPTKDDLTREMQWIYVKNMREPKSIKGRKQVQLVSHIFKKKESDWKLITSSRATVHGLVLCINLILLQTFMGLEVITIFDDYMFESVRIKLSEDLCSVIPIFGCIFASICVDYIGRRYLQISSCFVVFLCDIVLGVFFQLSSKREAPDWFTSIAPGFLALSVVVFNMGAGNIPYVALSEYFSAEVRDLANFIVMTVRWSSGLVLMYCFPLANDHYGTAQLFYFFAIVSFLGGLLSHLYVPETKGKTQHQILQDLENKTYYRI